MLDDHRAAALEVVSDHFELSGEEPGETPVRCPFHGDKSASASLNFEVGKFNCHGCGKAYSSIESLAEALLGEEPVTPPPEPEPAMLPEQTATLEDVALSFLALRGITNLDSIPGIEFEIENDTFSPLGGYLLMKSAIYGSDRYVARNLLDNGNPKYVNSPGVKGLFYLDSYDPDADHVWLVEGIFDALSLNAMGINQVAAALGSKVKPEDLYAIRHQTVFILFDNDWAGFSGARKTAEQLQKMGGNPVIVDMERALGDDPNDAHVRSREGFRSWLASQVLDYSSNDTQYVNQFLQNQKPLQLIPTSLPTLDYRLGGGFKDGVVVIGAEPGVGKTSFATWFAAEAVTKYSKKVLYVTYEISKRQVWSRLAAIASGTTWDVLELDPTRIDPNEREWVTRLSSNIRVAVGWNVNKIKHVIDDYDIVIVDYLQRMPGKPGEDGEERVNVSFNVRELSNLARDKGKVVIAISSLSRRGYGALNMSIFKESGDIEYAVQVAIALMKHTKTEQEDIIDCHILKNTRGTQGTVYLRSDLGHQRFEEAEPFQGQYNEPIS